MARIIAKALPLASRSHLPPPPPISTATRWQPLGAPAASPSSPPHLPFHPPYTPFAPQRIFHVSSHYSSFRGLFGGFFASLRGFRKVRRRQAVKKPVPKERQVELCVKICIEEEMPEDSEVLNIAEMLKLNTPMAMKIAFDGLRGSQYKTRDTSIDDIGKFEKVELSVLLCNDDYIQKLNKEWRGEDHATNVLSMSQHIPELDLPILIFGDIVISVETAARQAEQRGHTLLDEIRILMVHGLLHLLGFDHEISQEAEAEMEKEEELVLKSLGWKGNGLIKSSHDSPSNGNLQEVSSDGKINDVEKAGSLRFYKPKFSHIFCNMDGTLLNSKCQITTTTAEALREAISRGLNIVITTGKTRKGAINILKMVNLAGRDGIVSELSPGIFLQGLLVYGRHGREIFRRHLEPSVCKEAFLYSLEHEVPLVAFCEDKCLTLFEHPLVDSLHSVYHEPKAEVITSAEHFAASEIQKLVFIDTAEGVSSNLWPYWEEATKGQAAVVQAQPDMLEIIPSGTSKGSGVKILLDHLGVTAEEIMAIGDGEDDVEMLQLASFGVALSNGSEKAKLAADVIGAPNEEDGLAKAIYQYAF